MVRITLVLCLALGGCAAAAGIGSPDSWKVVKTKHVTLYTGMQEHRYGQTLVKFEYDWAALKSSFFRQAQIDHVEMMLMENEDFGEMFGYKRNAIALPTAPAGAPLGKDGLIVMKIDNEGDDSAEMLTHLMLNRMVPKAPLWFHEGLAAYIKRLDYKEGNGIRGVCFGKPATDPPTFIPLQQLFTMSWDDYDGDNARGWYKHTARAVIDFIVHYNNGQYFAKLPPIFEGLAAGKPTPDLLNAELGMSVDDLTKKSNEFYNEVAHGAQSGASIRGMCPLGVRIPDGNAPDAYGPHPPVGPLSPTEFTATIDALKKLPRRDDGYPAWYPPDVLARAK